MTAQRIDQLRALTDQEIPRPKQHGARLLFLRFDSNEAHGRSARRFRNRFRVFWRLTKGLTYAGGIKRTSCPASRIARPQALLLPLTAMATVQRGCSARKPRSLSRVSFLRKPTLPTARAPCA